MNRNVARLSAVVRASAYREVHLVLSRRDLVMAGLDLESHELQVVDDQPADRFRLVYRGEIEVTAGVVAIRVTGCPDHRDGMKNSASQPAIIS